MTARLRLRRQDGRIALDRRGIETKWFGVYLHKMNAADPGLSLHDHPWPFLSIVLKGGYSEERMDVRMASEAASVYPDGPRGWVVERPRWSWKVLRLTEAHRITRVDNPTWTLVLRGKKRQIWGFYNADGWISGSMCDEADRPMSEERP